MSNNIEQNGRQLSTEQAAPPTDPRTRGLRAVPPTPESHRICRDFVWGICSMNEQCKYRHELDYESMRQILKFCHDYQNRTGCTRPECTYLHASREEENLFLKSGVIPRVLAERYASMSVQSAPVPEVQPQMMYVNDYVAPPPPPPPPTVHNSPTSTSRPAAMGSQMVPNNVAASMHPTITPLPLCNLMPGPLPGARQPEQPSHAHMPLTVKTNLHAVMPSTSAPMSSLLAPPPPPPPPPPPTLTTAPTQMTAPVYTVAQPPQHTVPAMYSQLQLTQTQQQHLLVQQPPLQQPPLQQPSLQQSPLQQPQLQPPHLQQPQQSTSQYSHPVLFDPSRPPPPIPVKRPAQSEPEAGPSKVLKLDESNDSPCDSCIEQNLRSALEQQEIEDLQRDEERRRRIYDQKVEEYENGYMLLRSMLTPTMFRVVTDFMDINNPTEIFASSSSPTYGSSASTSIAATATTSSEATVPKQFLFQLMEFLVNKRNTDEAPAPPVPRRPTPSQADLMFASLVELLQNGWGRAGDAGAAGASPVSRNASSSITVAEHHSVYTLSVGTSENHMSALEGFGRNGLSRLTGIPRELMQQAARYAPVTPRYPAAAAPYVPTNMEVVPAPAPYQPEPPPPPPPQPVYVPYQSAPAPAPAPVPVPLTVPVAAPALAPAPMVAPAPMAAPAPAPQHRSFYHPYQASTSNMNGVPYAPAANATAPAPPPQPPYQYMTRMPHHYYPPYQ